MSFGGELEYAAVPPASEEPRRGVNRLTAETGCFGNGVSASTLDRCRGEFQKLRHLRHLMEQMRGADTSALKKQPGKALRA